MNHQLVRLHGESLAGKTLLGLFSVLLLLSLLLLLSWFCRSNIREMVQHGGDCVGWMTPVTCIAFWKYKTIVPYRKEIHINTLKKYLFVVKSPAVHMEEVLVIMIRKLTGVWQEVEKYNEQNQCPERNI